MKTFLNLLPPEQKESLRLAQRYRIILRQERGVLFLVIFFSMLLAGIWLLLVVEEGAIRKESGEKQRQDSAYAEVVSHEEFLLNTQKMMPAAEEILQKQKGMGWVFHFLEESIPDGVNMNSVLVKDESIKLFGYADTRDHLLLFREHLEKNECFDEVSLPWSQIAQKEKIDFEVSIHSKSECFLVSNKK